MPAKSSAFPIALFPTLFLFLALECRYVLLSGTMASLKISVRSVAPTRFLVLPATTSERASSSDSRIQLYPEFEHWHANTGSVPMEARPND